MVHEVHATRFATIGLGDIRSSSDKMSTMLLQSQQSCSAWACHAVPPGRQPRMCFSASLASVCQFSLPRSWKPRSAIHGLHVGRPQVRTPSCAAEISCCYAARWCCCVSNWVLLGELPAPLYQTRIAWVTLVDKKSTRSTKSTSLPKKSKLA